MDEPFSGLSVRNIVVVFVSSRSTGIKAYLRSLFLKLYLSSSSVYVCSLGAAKS